MARNQKRPSNKIPLDCKCLSSSRFLSFAQWVKKYRGLEHWQLKALDYPKWSELYALWCKYYFINHAEVWNGPNRY